MFGVYLFFSDAGYIDGTILVEVGRDTIFQHTFPRGDWDMASPGPCCW